MLDTLIHLFWENGYEATSLTDIVEATGLNKSSLYNAFGPKEVLLREALSRYVSLRSTAIAAVLIDGTAGLADIHALFDLLWQEFYDNGDRRGCLSVNCSTELGPLDDGVAVVSLAYRSATRNAFRTALTRAADHGEIAPQFVETYANLCLTTMLGLAVVVRSGAGADEVLFHVDAFRQALDSWKLS